MPLPHISCYTFQSNFFIGSLFYFKNTTPHISHYFPCLLKFLGEMGIPGPTQVVEEAKIPKSTMHGFQGKIVGHDLPCLLHKITCTKQGSDEFHAQPPMPFTSLANVVDREVTKFLIYGVSFIMVADGASHPMKIASEKKLTYHVRHMAEVHQIWDSKNVADYPSLQN